MEKKYTLDEFCEIQNVSSNKESFREYLEKNGIYTLKSRTTEAWEDLFMFYFKAVMSALRKYTS